MASFFLPACSRFALISLFLLLRAQSSNDAVPINFRLLLGDEDGMAAFFEDHFGRTHFLLEDSLRKNRVEWMRAHRQFVRHEDVDSILAKNASAEFADQPLRLGSDIDMLRIAQEPLGNWGRVKIASFYPSCLNSYSAVDDEDSCRNETSNSKGYFKECQTYPVLTVDHTKVHEAFTDGFELVVRKMEFRSQIVHEVVESLSSIWMIPVSASLHFMPNKLNRIQATAPTFRADDVFLVQLDGEQIVHVYPDAVDSPSTAHVTNDEMRTEIANSLQGAHHRTLVLKEGDVLYIPRGYAFDSRTDKQISLHIAIALETHSNTMADGIRSVIGTFEKMPTGIENPLLLSLPGPIVNSRSVPTYGDFLRMAVTVGEQVMPDLRKFLHKSTFLTLAFDEVDVRSAESELDRALGRFVWAAHQSLFRPLLEQLANGSAFWVGNKWSESAETKEVRMGQWAKEVLKGGKRSYEMEKSMFQRCLEFIREGGEAALDKARVEMLNEHSKAHLKARQARFKSALASLRRHGQVLTE